MESKQLHYVLGQFAARLDALGRPWCVFSGSAAACYLTNSPDYDNVNILLAPTPTEEVLDLFPEARRKALNCLEWAPVELWWGWCSLDIGTVKMVEKSYPFVLDAAMEAHIRRMTFGELSLPVMAPEDLVAFFSILQRGADLGQRDLENAQALLEWLGDRLDTDYLRQRARICRAPSRVAACLEEMGCRV